MTYPILITGATQRLGLAIANDLLAQGNSVIVTYRTPKPAIKELQAAGAYVINADFSTADGVTRAITDIQAYAPKLRAIIHNASDWDAEHTNNDKQALMEKMMQVHVTAPYRINLALADNLVVTGQVTDIIHMTDNVQHIGSDKHIAYAASKAALHNLTLSFAKKFAPHVKVNSIAPALLMFNEWDDEEYRQKSLQKSILQVVPGAQEAVKAVNYILDSAYVTGQSLNLNGGRHLK